MRTLLLASTVALTLCCGGGAATPGQPKSEASVRLPASVTADAGAPASKVHAVAQTGHRMEIWAIAYSPRGDLVATGSFDHTIRVWNDSGVMLGVLRGHREALTDLAWSPHGDVLASAARDGTIRLWDLHHAGRHKKLDHAGDHVAFDPTGEHVVTVGYDPQIRVWNASTGVLEHSLPAPRVRQLRSVAWSPDGKLITASSLDGGLLFWHTDTWTLGSEQTFGRFEQVRFSADGTKIAAVDEQHVVILEVATMTRRELTHADVTPGKLCFTGDGKTIVTSGSFGEIHLWDVASGAYRKALPHPGYIEALACAPTGDRVAVGGKVPVGNHVEDPVARVYDLSNGHEVGRLEGTTRPIEEAAWSTNGDTLFTATPDVSFWDARKGTLTGTVRTGTASVSWNRRRSLLALTEARSVRVLDSAGTIVGMVPLSGERSVAWSPDGGTLAIWTEEAVTLWNATSHTRRQVVLPAGRNYVEDVAFTPSSSEIVIATGKRVDAYSVDSGKTTRPYALTGNVQSWTSVERLVVGPHGDLAATLNGPGAVLFDAAGAFTASLADRSWFALPSFSPDGRTVAYSVKKHDMALWGAVTGHFVGHDDVVRSIAWSPDGTTLASSSDDQTVRVWRLGVEAPVQTFDTYDGRVWSVEWHPNGKALVGVGNDCMIHRLADGRTLHMVVTSMQDGHAPAAAWFTDAGEYAGDEKALGLVVLRAGNDLLDPKLGTLQWTHRPELLSDL